MLLIKNKKIKPQIVGLTILGIVYLLLILNSVVYADTYDSAEYMQAQRIVGFINVMTCCICCSIVFLMSVAIATIIYFDLRNFKIEGAPVIALTIFLASSLSLGIFGLIILPLYFFYFKGKLEKWSLVFHQGLQYYHASMPTVPVDPSLAYQQAASAANNITNMSSPHTPHTSTTPLNAGPVSMYPFSTGNNDFANNSVAPGMPYSSRTSGSSNSMPGSVGTNADAFYGSESINSNNMPTTMSTDNNSSDNLTSESKGQ